jgi:hypothetical protein
MASRVGVPHEVDKVAAVVGRGVISSEPELVEDPERRGVPEAHGRPNTSPAGREGCVDDGSRGLGGIAVAVEAPQQLVADLRLVERAPSGVNNRNDSRSVSSSNAIG